MKIYSFLTVAIAILLFASCTKYDEDDERYFKTPEKRIVGKWSLAKINDVVVVQTIDSTSRVRHNLSWNPPISRWIYETILIKSDVSWEFEEDKDFKNKYFKILRSYEYGLTSSNHANNSAPIYSTVDSSITVEKRKWHLNSPKTEIRIEVNNTTTEYFILKLTADQLKVEDDLGNVYLFNKI